MLKRIPILYLIFGVLILVSVGPLIWYGHTVVDDESERLRTNEQVLQNTITRSMEQELSHRQSNLLTMMTNLSSAVEVASGGDLSASNLNSSAMRNLLEKFVSSSENISYATLVSAESNGKGITAGNLQLDDFLRRELQHAFAAAREGRMYNGPAMQLGAGKQSQIVTLVSSPIMQQDRFLGMIGVIVNQQPLLRRLNDIKGLSIYVVDRQGRLVAGNDPNYATGQDMTNFEIVKNFVGSNATLSPTMQFSVVRNNERINMLGTWCRVPSLDWAVIAQNTQREAYQGIAEMKRRAWWLAFLVILFSILLNIFAARGISDPVKILTDSSRAIAKGDFSKRVRLKSRMEIREIGELAATFNIMSSDLERLVFDLKRAAQENRSLFLASIQMLAGAVDEKDPYTKGHSDRVTRYSVVLATELGLNKEDIEKIRISAQLHDVGKIGIEDRILKKPGALTPEEFEVMKTHTSKGASILRPVEALREMIPGIELHHESLDGRGYPHGLKGDQISLMPRIIMVGDTFDAMTTNRPYQAAMDPEYVVRIINSLANTKFDPRVVAALTAVFERGVLRLHRAATVTGDQVAAAAAGGEAGTPVAGGAPATPPVARN